MGQKGKFRTIQYGKNDGLMFYCPGCDMPHTVTVNGQSTWKFNGNYEQPTLTPSVLTTGQDEVCHLYITDGKLNFLGDCTHHLKNQIVDIPELPDWLKDEKIL